MECGSHENLPSRSFVAKSVTDSSSCVALKSSSMFGQGCVSHRLLPAKTERSRYRRQPVADRSSQRCEWLEDTLSALLKLSWS